MKKILTGTVPTADMTLVGWLFAEVLWDEVDEAICSEVISCCEVLFWSDCWSKTDWSIFGPVFVSAWIMELLKIQLSRYRYDKFFLSATNFVLIIKPKNTKKA